ncbi:unnamed protein product, partial [Owenia fusiformis]
MAKMKRRLAKKLGIKKVTFDIEKEGLFQGDIILNANQAKEMLMDQTILDGLENKGAHKKEAHRNKRSSTGNSDTRHIRVKRKLNVYADTFGRNINYMISPDIGLERSTKIEPVGSTKLLRGNYGKLLISASNKRWIEDGIAYWEQNTCLRFNKVTNFKLPLMLFVSNGGCNSPVGLKPEQYNQISISPGCGKLGQVAHEIGHSLGLWHEHARTDRGSYISIQRANIKKGPTTLTNFDIVLQDRMSALGAAYDFGSAMHYGRQAFSNYGEDTILTKDSDYERSLGQRVELSFLDMKIINTFYCSDSCKESQQYQTLDWVACKNNGYRDPNRCDSCKCLDGWSGQFCDQVAPSVGGQCGGLREAMTTIKDDIMTPGHPRYYKINTKCTWLITTPDGYEVVASFVTFNLGCSYSNMFMVEMQCKNEWVEVRHHRVDEMGPRFCCAELPTKTFVSTYNELMVLFRTFPQASTTFRGMQMQYYSRRKVLREPCKKLLVSGIEDPEFSYMEGIYHMDILLHKGRPTYRHDYEFRYIFFDEYNDGKQCWYIGNTIGNTDMDKVFLLLKSQVDFPEDSTLFNKRYKNKWAKTSMVVQCLNAKPPRGIRLSDMSLNGSPKIEGYYKLTSKTQYDRPIYKHSSNDLYIYHKKIREHTWMVGKDINSVLTGVVAKATADSSSDPSQMHVAWSVRVGSMFKADVKLHATAIYGESHCSSIKVTSSNVAVEDTYSLLPMSFADRPVYFGQRDHSPKYIASKALHKSHRLWLIGDAIGDIRLGVVGMDSFIMDPSKTSGDWKNINRRTLTLDDSVFVKMECLDEIENESVNECTSSKHDCHANAVCTDTPSSYTCTCKPGFTGDGTSCMDVNECMENTDNCHVHATCTNTQGTFTCKCKDGYKGTGVQCVVNRVNECLMRTHNCDQHATCIDTSISYMCRCKPGYTGNGKTCTDVNECAIRRDNCHTNADCINTIGSYMCDCKSGFQGTGRFCSDINECSTRKDNCHRNALCTNTQGSHICKCKSGYQGSGWMCTDINECSTRRDNCH